MNTKTKWSVIVVLAFLLQACGFNTKSIDISGSKGPLVQLVSNSKTGDEKPVLEVPDDIVFGTGIIEDTYVKTARYQMVLAKMPGALINEMLAYTYAWHHGAAYNKRTGESYRVQSLYGGTKGGFAGIPCGRYLEVLIEGLDSIDPDVFVVVGNARGDKWFDLRGSPVSFTQKDYLSGKWQGVASVGTSLGNVYAAYQNDDLAEAKDQIKNWASTGRYQITDMSDDSKIWYFTTPYSAHAGGTDIIKALAAINNRYSVANKALAAADGIVLSTSLFSTGLSVAIAAIRIPFIKEHQADEMDMNAMAERLDAETRAFNGCVRQPTSISVKKSNSKP